MWTEGQFLKGSVVTRALVNNIPQASLCWEVRKFQGVVCVLHHLFFFCYPRSQSSSCHSRHLLKSLRDLHAAEKVLQVGRLDEIKATLTLLLLLWPVASLRRYFVLDPESGQLHYFVNEQGKSQKPRGSLPLFGASVTPSDEAPHMFVVNSVNGELYKLRGESPRRFWGCQIWQCANTERSVWCLCWSHVLAAAMNELLFPPCSICE